LEQWAKDIPDYAIKLAREFWPGPMTLILPRKEIAKDFITGGQNNIGLRVPAQPIALALLKKFEELGGQGIAAPSANRFGAVSPTTAEAVGEELGDYLDVDDLVLDGGLCLVGIESTIIDCTIAIPKILRPGAITAEMVKEITQINSTLSATNTSTKASGLLESHYKPKANVLLNKEAGFGDGLIALSEISTPEGVIRLASPSNLEEYARTLYSALRSADLMGLAQVTIYLPTDKGLGKALHDRLTKASFNATERTN
jgi:L-threonylcarbamoyladenylate synthase